MNKISLAKIVDQLDQDKDLEKETPIKKFGKNPEGSQEIYEADEPEEGNNDSDTSIDATEPDLEEVTKVLNKVSEDLETLIDSLMDINTNKEYSKLIKLLQSATRIADELIESDDLLN